MRSILVRVQQVFLSVAAVIEREGTLSLKGYFITTVEWMKVDESR